MSGQWWARPAGAGPAPPAPRLAGPTAVTASRLASGSQTFLNRIGERVQRRLRRTPDVPERRVSDPRLGCAPAERHAAGRRQESRTDGSRPTRPFTPCLGAQAPRRAAAIRDHGRRRHCQRGGVRNHRRRAARLGARCRARQGGDGPGPLHRLDRDLRSRHFRHGDVQRKLGSPRRGLGRARVVIGRHACHVRRVLMQAKPPACGTA